MFKTSRFRCCLMPMLVSTGNSSVIWLRGIVEGRHILASVATDVHNLRCH